MAIRTLLHRWTDDFIINIPSSTQFFLQCFFLCSSTQCRRRWMDTKCAKNLESKHRDSRERVRPPPFVSVLMAKRDFLRFGYFLHPGAVSCFFSFLQFTCFFSTVFSCLARSFLRSVAGWAVPSIHESLHSVGRRVEDQNNEILKNRSFSSSPCPRKSCHQLHHSLACVPPLSEITVKYTNSFLHNVRHESVKRAKRSRAGGDVSLFYRCDAEGRSVKNPISFSLRHIIQHHECRVPLAVLD